MQSVTSNAVFKALGVPTVLYDCGSTQPPIQNLTLSDSILNYDFIVFCIGYSASDTYECYSHVFYHDFVEYIKQNNKRFRLTGFSNYYIDYSYTNDQLLSLQGNNNTIGVVKVLGVGKRS